MKHIPKSVFQPRTLVAAQAVFKIHNGVAAFHQGRCENFVNLPGLYKDRGEHEVGAEDGAELEEDAGVLVERAVEEQNSGYLAHQGTTEQEG